MSMKSQSLENVMTKNVQTVSETTRLCDVATVMKEHQIGDVIVTDAQGKLCGIVTDRDLVVRAMADGLDPKQATAGQICTKHDLATLAPDSSVDAAVQLMRDRAIRRIPVVKDHTAVGIVSIGDLAQMKDPDSALGRISSAPPNE